MTAHSPEPVWESTAMTDYRWQCACGHRYGNATPERGDVNAQHAEHLDAIVAQARQEVTA